MNKTLFITGAAAGIGAAAATLALQRGYRVIITDMNLVAAQELAARFGATALALALDVRSAEQWQQALDQAWQHFGRVDVLINNAGIIHPGYARNLSLDQHRQTVEVNFLGPLTGMLAALPRMKAQGSGHLLTICSMTAFAPMPGMASYAGTKHALRAFHHSLALEERDGPVRFTVIHPPAVETAMLRQEAQCEAASLSFAEPAISAESLAEEVLKAIERKPREVIFPALLGHIMRLLGATPGLAYPAIIHAQEQGLKNLRTRRV